MSESWFLITNTQHYDIPLLFNSHAPDMPVGSFTCLAAVVACLAKVIEDKLPWKEGDHAIFC